MTDLSIAIMTWSGRNKELCHTTVQLASHIVLPKSRDRKDEKIIVWDTPVHCTRLDPDNAEYIEDKVTKQQIVILTRYVKKTN